jgi:transposase-like protein
MNLTPQQRVDTLSAALRSGRSLSELSAELGVPVTELELWRAMYEATQQEAERRAAKTRVQMVAGLAVALALGTFFFSGDAWAQSCPQTLPAPMITFCPDAPALAQQVNGNFQQLATWVQQKVGPLGSNNVVVNGSLTVSSPDGGAGTVNLIGNPSFSGSPTVSGSMNFGMTTRQMVNLWGTNFGFGVQNSTLYARSDANFAWFVGGAHNDATLNPGAGGSTVMKLLPSGELIARGQYQSGPGAPTPYEVSLDRFVVEARVADVGSVVAIDQSAITRLCGDIDGCPFTISMVNWAGDNRVASRSGTLFLYQGGSASWRLELNAGDIEGTDSTSGVNEVSAWDCFFGDAETSTGTNNERSDTRAGFGLLNCRGCNYSDATTSCRMVFRD